MNAHVVSGQVPSSQRGAALAISLVILLVLTLVAVTASQVSRMQESMSGNTQQERTVFQATYSAIALAIDQFSDDVSVIVSVINSEGSDDIGLGDEAELKVRRCEKKDDGSLADCKLQQDKLKMTYTGKGCPAGFSCKNFEGYYFDIDAEMSINGTGASSDQTQGAMRVTPKE
ncbi:hypothetical protein KBTX_03560 [wastewater metagenome]|uniref:Type 4 fimbrial biogenesis protein PilX N-terminal domain-containing protein n=2 Tax=unclassified sequences TaxID=12908 RepID=A0A5B8RHW1_9ZZZZ|nr:PilX N-terminal domain-containing pilus assembly protein [Arhodomonas sp. KWT]QEA07212.1 hypothetical protein KBTEX_03560 [uncultured organism]